MVSTEISCSPPKSSISSETIIFLISERSIKSSSTPVVPCASDGTAISKTIGSLANAPDSASPT